MFLRITSVLRYPLSYINKVIKDIRIPFFQSRSCREITRSLVYRCLPMTEMESRQIKVRSKIELHIHMDGSVRMTTLWDLIQKKKLYPEYKTLEQLCNDCKITEGSSLENFLKPFIIIKSAISGDSEALERIAYELCEDEAREGVIYFEMRFSPHLCSTSCLSPEEVLKCIIKGLNKGQKDFNIKAKIILCCIRGHPEWSENVLDLCVKYKNDGVVGIDIAGDEAQELASFSDIEIFKKAKELGIHRTVHAGEAGPASNVSVAIQEMYAERIGHGYHIVDDETIYKNILSSEIHFEVCPYSSYLTGSVSHDIIHPVVRFAEDNLSFSINKDDTTIIGKTLDDEYDLLRKLGLTDVHFTRANFNAAKSSFLSEEEKRELILKLKMIYNIPENI